MIVKSNVTVSTDSAEITSLCDFMTSLDLPAGAQLTAFTRTWSDPAASGPNSPTTVFGYNLTFEWETEV